MLHVWLRINQFIYNALIAISIHRLQETAARWGARAFSKAAPVLWNTLSSTIKTASSLASFKIGLATYLFKNLRSYTRM